MIRIDLRSGLLVYPPFILCHREEDSPRLSRAHSRVFVTPRDQDDLWLPKNSYSLPRQELRATSAEAWWATMHSDAHGAGPAADGHAQPGDAA